MPSVVAVQATDQAHYDEVDYQTSSQQQPPLANTDFTAVDDGPTRVASQAGARGPA